MLMTFSRGRNAGDVLVPATEDVASGLPSRARSARAVDEPKKRMTPPSGLRQRPKSPLMGRPHNHSDFVKRIPGSLREDQELSTKPTMSAGDETEALQATVRIDRTMIRHGVRVGVAVNRHGPRRVGVSG